jgi:hypothetical protein
MTTQYFSKSQAIGICRDMVRVYLENPKKYNWKLYRLSIWEKAHKVTLSEIETILVEEIDAKRNAEPLEAQP